MVTTRPQPSQKARTLGRRFLKTLTSNVSINTLVRIFSMNISLSRNKILPPIVFPIVKTVNYFIEWGELPILSIAARC